ncbi:MAG: DUF1585 domain-containing protein, partial [Myxococcales bacterium]|nr:DUF1585 domain-containing protein [Myxococcales bacterium]
TTRSKFEAHVADPQCAVCHSQFDPLGFAFEHYDAVGRYRDKEGAETIDSSGVLMNTDVDGEFADAEELLGRLAESGTATTCLTRRWFRFAYGRREAGESDECSIQTLHSSFVDQGGDIRQLIVDVTTSDAFRYRRVAEGPGGEP